MNINQDILIFAFGLVSLEPCHPVTLSNGNSQGQAECQPNSSNSQVSFLFCYAHVCLIKHAIRDLSIASL